MIPRPVLLLAVVAILTAGDSIPCRIAHLRKVHYAPVLLAFADGIFAAHGIAAEPVAVGPGSGILSAEALFTGAADAAAMGDGPTLISCSRDPLPLLLGAYIGAERQHRLVAREGVAITVPEDLIGRRLGVHFGSSTHSGLLLLLRRRGILPDAVTLVNLNPKDMAAAMQGRQIDVAAASDPIPDLIQRTVAGCTPAGDLSGLGTDYPYCLVVSRRWVAAHPEGPERLRAAMRAALATMAADPRRAVRVIAAATGDAEEDAARWMAACTWSWRQPEMVIPGMELLAAAMGDARVRPERLVQAAAP